MQDEEIIYPQNIQNLYEKLNYIIQNEENEEKILQIKNWLKWYESQSYDFKYVCKENEYLKEYSVENKYSLQIWKHESYVDSIVFNLLSNYYSEYDNEITEIRE